MSPTNPVSNVYYLTPPVPPAERPTHRSPRLTLRLRLLAFRWRLRLTVLDVWAAVRRFGRTPEDLDLAFLEQRAELTRALSRPPAGPARIIDLAAARTRRRA